MKRPLDFVVKRLRLTLLPILLAAVATITGAHMAHAPAPEQPLTALSGRRILLDPGHGGVDGGCHYGDVLEKHVVLSIAEVTKRRLQALGARVGLTRTEDVSLERLATRSGTRHGRDLWARVEMAANQKAEVFVSIHANSGANPAMRGALTFYKAGSEPSKQLATLIQRQLEPIAPGNQNAILPARFFVLRHNPAPLAVLVEVGFLSNPTDRMQLQAESHLVQLGEAIAKGIEAYLNESHVYGPTDPSGQPSWSELSEPAVDAWITCEGGYL